MEDANIPLKIPQPWGAQTDSGNIVNPIPNTSQPGGQASWPTGFPDINSVLVASGGIPPWGNAMNGVLYALSAVAQWVQAGGQWPYDGTFQTTIGGYAKGSIVQSAANYGNFWQSTADSNTTDPDTGGAGWIAWPLVYYAVDTGAVNALAAAFPTAVPLAAIPVGTILYVNPAYTSTSTMPTLAVSGGSAVTITAPTGASLLLGALVRQVPAAIMVGPSSTLWLLNPQVGASAGATGQANGQCRLVYSSSTLVTLIPYNGNGLIINGVLQTIPAGGVTLNVSTTTAGLNYVYAAVSGGNIVLSASTTAYSTATNGTPVKSTDVTVALVGMIWIAGGVFTAQLVATWYNRRPIDQQGDTGFTSTTTSGSLIDLGAGAHVICLVWADTGTSVAITSYASSFDDSINSEIWTSVGLDGAAIGAKLITGGAVDGGQLYVSATLEYASLPTILTEGLHTFSIWGAVTQAGGALWDVAYLRVSTFGQDENMAIVIGPNFPNEIAAAGLSGLPFSWNPDGTITYGGAITSAQKTVIETVLAAHNPALPNPNVAAFGMLAIGIAVTSTGASGLNGIYPCDPGSQSKIVAEATYVLATGGPGTGRFTNGQTTRAWYDTAGAAHTFDTTQFIAFAEAVAQFVDAILAELATCMPTGGTSWSPPSNAYTIA